MSATRRESGGRIDRNARLDFSWDGQRLSGYSGDTLASALLANGVQILGRSFKYHRPRGVMSAGVEESGAIVSVGEGARLEPNVKATQQELYDGLSAHGQNAWPSVRHDAGAVSGWLSRFFVAGFYYKTFMGLPPLEWGRGTGIWMQYEKLIRKAAGMGRASREPDPDCYEHAHAHCDVLVVGAGPAGLHAAVAAARQGRDVVLVEQDFELGGDYLNHADTASATRLRQLVAAATTAGVRIMTRTTAFGLYDGMTAGLLERLTDHQARPHQALPRQCFWTVRTQGIILATGALERSVAFNNNDRPGVMTAAAARTYLNRFAVQVGQRIVISTNNDSVYDTATELASAGAEVIVADVRQPRAGSGGDAVAGDAVAASSCADAQAAGVTVLHGRAACTVSGRRAVQSVGLATDTSRADQSRWRAGESLDCDALLISGGWSPVVNLLSHRGVAPVWDAVSACFVAGGTDERIVMAGAAAGCWSLERCEDSGADAVKALDASGRSAPVLAEAWPTPITPLYEVALADKRSKSFVDFQHDVTSDDVRLAHQEGFVSVEHMKRYTTLGMATDQGKMGNVIGLALMADALGTDIPSVGSTRFRPPYTPVAIGALAGRQTGAHFKPLRRTPLHEWNLRHGATMTEAGLWRRPWYFAEAGETISDAYVREAATVRKTAGICDVSSLGKIAIQGPDAAEFLHRVYSNAFAKLPVGKARYGIMLRDDGMVMDDGTTWHISENNYLMTTTTAHAGVVMVWLEELLQTRWPELRVHVASVSDHWAGISIAGPQARSILAACVEDATRVAAEQLPFMGVIATRLRGGIDCLIARISFSGELAYEVYVCTPVAESMMDLLWAATSAAGGCLYGLEALGTLRIEKGHVTGAELDGRVTIDDAGLGGMASDSKSYIGSQLRRRPELQRPNRPQLVGIYPQDRQQVFNGGALLCKPEVTEGFGEGWVTAVTHSPALGHWIGLGFINGGHTAWTGKSLVASDPVRSDDIAVEIVSPHMFDPEGVRMHG